MQSLKRKTMLWEDAKRSMERDRQRAAAARTGQVVRSTVDVYGEPTQLDQMLEEASDAVVITAEQEEAILILDEDQASGLDHFLDGDGSDIEDIIDAGELGVDNSESDADRWAEHGDAADQVHIAHMEAIAALVGVDEAKREANEAAEVAANAQTTANGKNARRRGATEPDPPAGGWVQGDQWVVDNADGVPIEVRVWNGTEFVRDQLLADELLILGEDGVIRLANGTVYAPSIAAGALDFKVARGMEISSGRFVGGVFELADLVQDEQAWAHQCDDLAGVDYAGTGLALDTARKRSGTASVKSPDGKKALGFGVPNKTANIVSAWVYSEVDAFVEIHAWELSGYEPTMHSVRAGAWVEITTQNPAPGTAKPVSYVTINTLANFPLWVDQVEARIVTVDDSSGVKLFRDQLGSAMLESFYDGFRTRVMGGGVHFDNVDNPNNGVSSIGPWGFSSKDSNSRLRISKESSSPGAGITLHAGSSPSQSASIGITGYGSSIVLDAENVSHRGDQPWTTVNPVSPFALYTAGNPVMAIRQGGMVTITGVLTCNTAGHLTGSTNRQMLNLPEWAKPWRTFYGVAQGTGTERYYITAGVDGVFGTRYSGTQSAGVWLPFSITYPGKPI